MLHNSNRSHHKDFIIQYLIRAYERKTFTNIYKHNFRHFEKYCTYCINSFENRQQENEMFNTVTLQYIHRERERERQTVT